MAEYGSYSPEDVIGANLRETSQRINMIWEQEMAHLRELAEQIAIDSDSISDLPHALPDHRPPKFDHTAKIPKQNASFIKKQERLLDAGRCVYLCSEIRKRLHTQNLPTPEFFFSDTEELPEHVTGRIIYQRNSYADSAYLRFASLLPAPRALYAHSFPALCEEVYNGLCEYCILPLENSAEGQLNSFSRLIDRYALKIAATCDIPATDGMRITRFALLRRDPILLPAQKEQERFFEFSLFLDGDPTPDEILSAARLCGLTLHRLDCRTQPEAPSQLRVHYVFRVENGDLTTFLLYLSMEAPQYDVTGIYFHLND